MGITNPYPDLEILHSLAGAAIANAYGVATASPVFNVGRLRFVRFHVNVVTDAASNLTSITIKLKQRYRGRNNGQTGSWQDLPSNLDDVQGAAQPKGSTREIEHAFTVAANGNVWFNFLYIVQAVGDVALDFHANAAGLGADVVSIFGEAGASY